MPEVIPTPVPQKTKPKEVSYTKNPTLNKILNETARGDEYEEYPTMTGTFLIVQEWLRLWVMVEC